MAKRKSNFTQALSKSAEKVLLYLTNPRIKDVIERRFGIRDGKSETLESIGKGYGITRERVRQIQDAGLRTLKSGEVFSLFTPIFKELDRTFNQHGHIMGEDYLYSAITGIKEHHPLRGKLYLVLTLGEPYQRVINDDRFHPYWIADSSARNRAIEVVDFLINHFNKSNQVLSESEVLNTLSRKYSNLSNQMFYVVLDISREINKNIFNELGLTHWSEISPQGVKDRAYLVLKKRGEPLHFINITEMINKSFADKPAYMQTVHNELIKDPRFVLTGRGTYALAEWGYEPGTVEEVIKKILTQAKRPMTKKEILEAVLAQRQVKPTTVVLNLQRSPKTQRLGDGRFTLV